LEKKRKKTFIENNLISVGIGKGTSIMILKNIPVGYDLRHYNSTIYTSASLVWDLR
jgi:hypothetical protein